MKNTKDHITQIIENRPLTGKFDQQPKYKKRMSIEFVERHAR